jgi:hypothetical protein
MHEEPIVRSPEEAIIAFQQSKLYLLILGPFLVSQAEQIQPTPYFEKTIFAEKKQAAKTF